MKARLATLIIALGSISAFSLGSDPTQFHVEVRAMDMQGQSLPGVRVRIETRTAVGATVEGNGTTGADGSVYIQVPRNGQFTVSAELPGFLPVSVGPLDPPAASENEAAYGLGVCMNIPPGRRPTSEGR